MKYTSELYEKLSSHFKFHLNGTSVTTVPHDNLLAFLHVSRKVLIGEKMFRTNCVQKKIIKEKTVIFQTI
jgi:hypothetical protein